MLRSILPILIILIGITSLPVQANSRYDAFTTFQLSKNNGQSLESAVHRIKKQTGGRILAARTVTKNGRTFHKIKVLLPSGKVRVFTVNVR